MITIVFSRRFHNSFMIRRIELFLYPLEQENWDPAHRRQEENIPDKTQRVERTDVDEAWEKQAGSDI